MSISDMGCSTRHSAKQKTLKTIYFIQLRTIYCILPTFGSNNTRCVYVCQRKKHTPVSQRWLILGTCV